MNVCMYLCMFIQFQIVNSPFTNVSINESINIISGIDPYVTGGMPAYHLHQMVLLAGGMLTYQ